MFEIKISTPSGEAGAICDTLESAIRTIEENTPGVYNKPVTLEGFTVAPGTQEVVRHTKDGFTGFWAASAANDPAAVVLTPEETGDGLFCGFPVGEVDYSGDKEEEGKKFTYAHTGPYPVTQDNLEAFIEHVNREHPEYVVNMLMFTQDGFYL